MEFEFAYYSLVLVGGIAFGYGLNAVLHWFKTKGGGW
jgi:hypothetical protein